MNKTKPPINRREYLELVYIEAKKPDRLLAEVVLGKHRTKRLLRKGLVSLQNLEEGQGKEFDRLAHQEGPSADQDKNLKMLKFLGRP